MRAHEFIKENASAGSTSAGNVATVVKPQASNKKGQTFFGGEEDRFPKYGDVATISVIRRPSPTAEADKK